MRNKGNSPALTSPWKIGVLVALLLLITNVGVGYYVVNQYGVDLKWLSSNSRVWGIETFAFFKEVFPLAAGIIICSLFSYFVIASAVRRYRYYVDSGQDYRKLVSIADSIDDLTNQTQIARLSNYPELQNILINYGDKIREISEGINSKEEQFDAAGLEKEIDSVLDGKPVLQSSGEEKPWADLIRKIDEGFRMKDKIIEETNEALEDERKKMNQMGLSLGKVLESADTAIRDISTITFPASQAREFLNNDRNVTKSSSAENTGQEATDVKSAVSNMKRSLNKLEKVSTAMRDFSEKNNGLALNIALMAARGNIDEGNLAGFAEKARETAEKFNKLGDAVVDLHKDLDSNYKVFKSYLLNNDAGGSSKSQSAEKIVSRITADLEQRKERLGANLASLKNDLERINAIFRGNSDQAFAETEDEIKLDSEYSQMNEGTVETNQSAGAIKSDSEEELVISNGANWDSNKLDKEDGSQAAEDHPFSSETESEVNVKRPEDTFSSDFASNDLLEPDNEDIRDDSGNSDIIKEESQDETFASLDVIQNDKSAESKDINVEFIEDTSGEVTGKFEEKTEQQPSAEEKSADVETSGMEMKESKEPGPDRLGLEVAYRKHLDKSVMSQAEVSKPDEDSDEKVNDEGPIVDLFDLGAVEIESAEARQ
ncbi:MAG TPA: hypothetical protein VKO43_07490 [Candidatus Krumholzibacteriaceae bacterium]|nr:hypothetical protein [Candidatus Krumholzibacteriaceae bacterium]